MYDPEPRSIRAQSEVLGVALLIGIAIVGAIAVLVTGLSALDRDQERVGIEQAERSLSQFDARVSDVALGDSEAARIDFGLPDTEGTMSIRPDEGWIWVQYTDLTGQNDPNTINVTGNSTDGRVSLGSVVFAQGSRTVGYQAGGVFRSNGNGSVLVSRPEFHYRNGTLTVPIINTDGRAGVASNAHITPNETVRKFPDPSRNLANKVDNSTVVVTVKSRYYEGWAEFFREYTSGIVTVDPSNQITRVQFISLPDDDGVGGGIVATAESGKLALEGTGAYVDSYNSSEGPYDETQNVNGTIRSVGNVTMTGDSEVNGSVEVGAGIDMDGDSLVTGDVLWTESKDIDGTVEGDINQTDDGVPTVLPIDPLVFKRVQELELSNDNEDSFVPKPGGDVVVTDTKTLDAGRYYMDSLEVNDGKLVINTTGGNVTIGVEDYVTLPKGGEIAIEGNGTVKVYLNADETKEENPTGEGKQEINFYVGKGSTVSIPANRAPQLRIFAQQEIQGYIGGSSGQNATFNGLIYAPDGLKLDGDFFTKQAQVYGGVVAGTVRLGQYGQVHYDKNLNDLELPQANRISRLEYMHVVVHRVTAVPE